MERLENLNPDRMQIVKLALRRLIHTHMLELLLEHYGSALLDSVMTNFDFRLRESCQAGIPIPLLSTGSCSMMQNKTLFRDLYANV